jgi:hypothetical protein
MRSLCAGVSMAVAIAAGPVFAQPLGPHCAGPVPFTASEANRVPAKDMQKLFAGKSIEYVRRIQVPGEETPRGRLPPTTVERIYSAQYRTDGSLTGVCEVRAKSTDPFTPCRGGVGPTTVGVWRIADGMLCHSVLGFRDGQEACVSIHRQDGRYAAKLARGPWTCLEGEFLFK